MTLFRSVAAARPELRAILCEAKSRVALGSTAAEALAIAMATAQSRLPRALPVLPMVAAAGVAGTVMGSNRGAVAVMATMPGLLAVTGCALMGGCGLALVARLTR